LAKAGLARAVAALERALRRVGSPHMLIGGVAVVAHGVRRLTDDVDATIWADGLDVRALVSHLEREGIELRIDDGLAFAERTQVLLLRHRASGIDVDLSLAWLPFEKDALDRAELHRVGGKPVRVATASDLIVYKAIASRERDRSDVERLLEIYGTEIQLTGVRRRVRELAEALERPELLENLNVIVKRVLPRRTAKRAHRARKKG
jgi:predicted nucleotidyltransferase